MGKKESQLKWSALGHKHSFILIVDLWFPEVPSFGDLFLNLYFLEKFSESEPKNSEAIPCPHMPNGNLTVTLGVSSSLLQGAVILA